MSSSSSSSDSSDNGSEPNIAQVAHDLNNLPEQAPSNPLRMAANDPLSLPLELLWGLFQEMDEDTLFNFSQLEEKAKSAVIWYLETNLNNQLNRGPTLGVFSIAVKAFPPEKFGANLDASAIQEVASLTSKGPHGDAPGHPVLAKPEQKYLMFLCNQILVAHNVCKYVEDQAARIRSWSYAHRPYVESAKGIPRKASSRSLKSMMMLWYCLVTVKDSIEEQRAKRNRPLTSDWLKAEVEKFVAMVAPNQDEATLITICRGFYFLDSLIEVVRQDPRVIQSRAFALNDNQAAWTCNLLYQGLDRFLEVLTEEAKLKRALRGDLDSIASANGVNTDIWETYIRDVLNSEVLSIRYTPRAYIGAPRDCY